MKKKLLVTGGSGQVATEYLFSQPLAGWEFSFLSKSDLDITSVRKVSKAFDDMNPDVVLNLAAYTNVEKAEKEDTEKAFNVNAIGPKNLAIECNRRNIPLIHVSTDYVFDGKSELPYTEESMENPINQYGRTKFLGEKWVQESHDWYYILRVSWVYSNHSKNFLTTMLKLAQERTEINVVDDQYGSPTSAKEICRAVDSILLSGMDKSLSGIYHFSGIGRTNWKDFASEIFYQSSVNIQVNGISSSSWPSKVERPSNTYMSSEKFSKTFNYTPAHWKNALKEVLIEARNIPVKVGDFVTFEESKYIIVSTDWLKQSAMIADPLDFSKTVEISFDTLRL